jgi:ADP-heptose:LPS heptosyltransferase
MAALGDGLMASPAFRLLKTHLPGYQLDVLCRAHVSGYFRSLETVDEVIPFASNQWLNRKKPYLLAGAVPEVVGLLGRLAMGRYSATLQWRGQFTDTMLAWATRAPHRIAAVHPFHRKSPLPVEKVPFLVTDLERVEDDHAHLIKAMAAPAARLIEKVTGARPSLEGLKMEFPVTVEDRESADRFLAGHGLEAGRFACVSFSSKTEANAWPAERFAEVADHLQERCGLRVLLDGLPMHVDREEAIVARMRTSPVRSAGQLRLGEIATVMGRSRLVICFNSAPMHLASIFGASVVVIGGRDGAGIRPWGVPHEVVTRNPYWPKRHPDRSVWPTLVPMVPAEDVVAAVDRVLDAS